MSAINFPKHLKTTDNLNGKWYGEGTHLGKRARRGDSVMSSLANAHEGYRSFCENIVAAVQSPDPAATEAGHFIEMRDLAFKKITGACRANDRARDMAKAEIAACRNAMRNSLELVENQRAPEIRAYLRSLPEVERADIIATAVEEGDSATIAAVVNAQAFLSGETTKRAELLRQQYEKKHNPELAERIDDLEQALAINTEAGKDVLEFVDSLLPFKKYEELKAQQVAAQKLRDAIKD